MQAKIQADPALYTQAVSQDPRIRVRPRRGAQAMVVPLASAATAGMARVQGFSSGEPSGGHLSALRSLAREQPLLRESALHMTSGLFAVARLVYKGQG